MPGISIHVVDVSRGVVAAGMKVELFHDRALLTSGFTSGKGLLEERALDARFSPGNYEAVFHVADYYRREGVALPERPFLHVVHYHFGINSADHHYHLPFKCTPWGYSCFRGGA
jgi:5-hydroxyisourate hydrolase